MGFDKVLMHLVDTYFKSGKANLFYKDQSEIDRIIKRAEKIRPLQVGKIAPDLAMIKATDRDKIAQMGFENVKTNFRITYLPPPSLVKVPSDTVWLVIVFTIGICERMSLTSSFVM